MWIKSEITLPESIVKQAVEQYLNAEVLRQERDAVVTGITPTKEGTFVVRFEVEMPAPDDEPGEE